jgi:glucose-1-phosphate adenylyltransferase
MKIRVLGLIMAGGRGERLYPLTRDRAKPAVPFGGQYRIIDFVLSNFVNSGIHSLYVFTQFKSQSLDQHIQHAYQFGRILRDHFIVTVPAQMQTGTDWYRGTADCVYQNLNLIREASPDLVAVFGADHIYRMDIRQMVSRHLEQGADVSVAALPVPRAGASTFGVVQVAPDWRITGFQEKPAEPAPLPGRPDQSLISMGNYLFGADLLVELMETMVESRAAYDFGRDIFPRIIADHRVYAYDFTDNHIPGAMEGELNWYWKDVGSIDAFYEANMELKSVKPPLNLYNREWPILSSPHDAPPVKFVFNDEGRRGFAADSIICHGSIVSGGRVTDSILGRDVFIHSWADVSDSILMDGVEVGRNAFIRRAIIDKNVVIPPGTVIGDDPEEDRRQHHVSPGGVVVIPKTARKRDMDYMPL